MSTAAEALELEIERAYLERERLPGRQTLWLAQCGTLRWCGEQHGTAVEVGTYERSVQLYDLREDVFHVYQAMRRRPHG